MRKSEYLDGLLDIVTYAVTLNPPPPPVVSEAVKGPFHCFSPDSGPNLGTEPICFDGCDGLQVAQASRHDDALGLAIKFLCKGFLTIKQ